MVDVYIRMCKDITHEDECGEGLLPLCGGCKVILRRVEQEELNDIMRMKGSGNGEG